MNAISLSFRSLLALVLLISFGSTISLSAQSYSRSGSPAPSEDKGQFRKFPCGGTAILNQGFGGTALPAGWTVRDEDQLTPNANIQFLTPNGGWQSVIDFKDTSRTNRLLASPSWYEGDAGPSDDWLISPRIANLPANTCLSWYAYSQDNEFPETYEVRISTSDAEIATFLANDSLLIVEGESSLFTYRSLDLSDFAGEDIYLAFHHMSNDKFILALDDIRLAPVEQIDLAFFNIEPIAAPAGSDITLSGALINRGLKEIDLDSVELSVYYSIDGGDVEEDVFLLSSLLEANDSLQFVHDSLWTPTSNAIYRVKFWVDALDGDTNQANDTLAFWQGIGTLTSTPDPQLFSAIQLYPNPVQDRLFFAWENGPPATEFAVQITDLMGRVVIQTSLPYAAEGPYSVSTASLTAGQYFFQVNGSRPLRFVKKD
jgi:hypothetical protein